MEKISEEEYEFLRKEREIQKLEKQASDAKKIMDDLSDYVNYNKSNIAFIEAFKREHRTLQQSMFKMFLELIEQMATDEYRTDGRNEESKKMAKTLLEGFKIIKKQEYIEQGVSEQRAEEYVTLGNGPKPSCYLPLI